MAKGIKAGLSGLRREQINDGTLARNASPRPGLLSASVSVSPFAAPLYERDVHVTLTEALAIAAGFSDQDARDIASFNQDVDDDKSTTPMPLGPWDEASGAGTRRRRLWHFTSAARQAQVKREYRQSGSLKDLGRYLHVLQDGYSHRGLSAIIGQFGTSLDTQSGEPMSNSPNPFAQSPWHEADDPSKNPGKAMLMARRTYDELIEAKEYLEAHRKITRTFAAVSYEPEIAKLVEQFAREPHKPARETIANQIGAFAYQRRLQLEEDEYSELQRQFEETGRRRTGTIQPKEKKPTKQRN